MGRMQRYKRGGKGLRVYSAMLTVGSSFFWGWESAFVQSGQDFRMIAEALAVKLLMASSRTEHPFVPSTHSPLQSWTNNLASTRSLWFASPRTSLASVHAQACLGAGLPGLGQNKCQHLKEKGVMSPDETKDILQGRRK